MTAATVSITLPTTVIPSYFAISFISFCVGGLEMTAVFSKTRKKAL
jgi:hypothetical protein